MCLSLTLVFAMLCRVVEFATSSDMKTALSKLDNTDLCGRKIKLTEDDDRGDSRRRR